MAIVTIPYDFDQLEEPFGVVPICIEDRDRDGCRIDPGWFAAVVFLADVIYLPPFLVILRRIKAAGTGHHARMVGVP